MTARQDAAELALRFETLKHLNEMTAERDRALMQRDQARRERQVLETQLRIITAERDEARALGRVA